MPRSVDAVILLVMLVDHLDTPLLKVARDGIGINFSVKVDIAPDTHFIWHLVRIGKPLIEPIAHIVIGVDLGIAASRKENIASLTAKVDRIPEPMLEASGRLVHSQCQLGWQPAALCLDECRQPNDRYIYPLDLLQRFGVQPQEGIGLLQHLVRPRVGLGILLGDHVFHRLFLLQRLLVHGLLVIEVAGLLLDEA